MFSESAPTNLRSSITTINTLAWGIFGSLGILISMWVQVNIPEKLFGLAYLCLAVPGLVCALIIVIRKVGETKDLDLKTVTGCEWDL